VLISVRPETPDFKLWVLHPQGEPATNSRLRSVTLHAYSLSAVSSYVKTHPSFCSAMYEARQSDGSQFGPRQYQEIVRDNVAPYIPFKPLPS